MNKKIYTLFSVFLLLLIALKNPSHVFAGQCCDYQQGVGCVDNCSVAPDDASNTGPGVTYPDDVDVDPANFRPYKVVVLFDEAGVGEAGNEYGIDPDTDGNFYHDGPTASHPNWDIMDWCEDKFYTTGLTDACVKEVNLPADCRQTYPSSVYTTDPLTTAQVRVNRLKKNQDGSSTLVTSRYPMSTYEGCHDDLWVLVGGQRENLIDLPKRVPVVDVSSGTQMLMIPGYTIRSSGSKSLFDRDMVYSEGQSVCISCKNADNMPNCKFCPKVNPDRFWALVWYTVSPTNMCTITTAVTSSDGAVGTPTVTLGGFQSDSKAAGGTFTNIQPNTNNYPVTDPPSYTLSVPSVVGYDNTPPTYTVEFTNGSSGTGNVTNVSGTTTVPITINESVGCSAKVTWNYTKNVPPPPAVVDPWWQVSDNDVVTRSSIKSVIPLNLGTVFNLTGVGGTPGVNILWGNLTVTTDPAQPQISATNWYTGTYYSGYIPDFDYLYSVVDKAGVVFNEIGSGNPLVKDPATGVYWFRYMPAGNTTLHLPADVVSAGEKAVLFVGNVGNGKVDVAIDGNITVGSSIGATDNLGGGFYLITDGNVSLAPTVSALEGVIMTDGTFNTGTSGVAFSDASTLSIRGSVIAKGAFTLARFPASTVNKTQPAEKFEYAPDLVLSLPSLLKTREVIWREVVPGNN